MTKYLLDTNIISYLADAKSRFHAPVMTAFEALSDDRPGHPPYPPLINEDTHHIPRE